MGEMAEIYRDFRDAQKERRADRLQKRTSIVLSLRSDGFIVKELTPYQFRVNGVLDIYPLHHRFHDIKRNRRGGFKHLKKFVVWFFKEGATK